MRHIVHIAGCKMLQTFDELAMQAAQDVVIIGWVYGCNRDVSMSTNERVPT